MAHFAYEGKRTTVRASPRRILSFSGPLSSKGHRSAGRSNGTRQGGSKIVHFRQLFRKALGRPFSLDAEGKSRKWACATGQGPKEGPSFLFPVSATEYEERDDSGESNIVHFCHPYPAGLRSSRCLARLNIALEWHGSLTTESSPLLVSRRAGESWNGVYAQRPMYRCIGYRTLGTPHL